MGKRRNQRKSLFETWATIIIFFSLAFNFIAVSVLFIEEIYWVPALIGITTLAALILFWWKDFLKERL